MRRVALAKFKVSAPCEFCGKPCKNFLVDQGGPLDGLTSDEMKAKLDRGDTDIIGNVSCDECIKWVCKTNDDPDTIQ